MRIAVVGAGYVGLVGAACLAELGHQVVCIDRDAERIARLNRGEIPIHELGLEPLVRGNLESGRLRFSALFAIDGADAEVVFIAVGTPGGSDGRTDLSAVNAAAAEIAKAITGPTVVAIKSTVPVGTADAVEAAMRAANPRAEFALVSNPEFLREGLAVGDFMKPERIVVGTDDAPGAGGDGGGLCRACTGADRHGIAAERGADQVCGQQLSRDAAKLHQRDRGPLRCGRRRCR